MRISEFTNERRLYVTSGSLIEKHLNAVSSIVVNKVIKMVKRQVCFTIEEEVVKKMEDLRDTTGIPVSKQIELALKGYKIEKVEQR